jgi:DNA primase
VATLGTALTAQHVGLLRRLSPDVVYLCFDGDSAGMRAALRTAPLFAEHSLDVRVVRLPKEHDPDTYIREMGASGMESALRTATPLARYRLEAALQERDLADLSERSEAMRAAAEVIADVASDTEREGYIAWLTDHLANQDGMSTPRGRQLMEAAVRRELGAEQKRTEQSQRKWQSRSDWWAKRAAREKGFTPQDPEQAAAEAHEVAQTLASVSQGISPGVLKAEKALICTLLAHPAWRNHILERLPASRWTNETHFEIVSAIKKLPEGADVVPVEFMQGLSDPAGEVVSEVMLADDAQNLPEIRVINDWIARVERYWARQTETEMLELIRSKVGRGEKVTPEEMAALSAALTATKRKMPVPAKD